MLRCLFHFYFYFLGKKPPCFFVCGVNVKGGGAAHVCMAHSLIEFIMRFISFCASIHLSGGKIVVSCRRFVS